MIRYATAIWNGSGKEGRGSLTTESNILDNTKYSFSSRFEEGTGTNPEELIAAAHAGCFTMKLSFNLGSIGFTPEELKTTCKITFEGGEITKSHLVLKAIVEGISEEKFAEMVKDAELNCPISRLLRTTIVVDYKLNP